jgi:broad specificity phosphatase PhoE
MLPDHVSLRRQPLFTPIWLTVIGAFCGLVVMAGVVWILSTADATTVVIVRHAEKQSSGGDPPLTPEGEARAASLARLLGESQGPYAIDAIYVSPTLRSRMTAAPLAARLGLKPIVAPGDAPRALARRVLSEHAGGRVLIVGHRDTINDILEALGAHAKLPPITDQDYGTMYVVSVPRIGRTNVLRISY